RVIRYPESEKGVASAALFLCLTFGLSHTQVTGVVCPPFRGDISLARYSYPVATGLYPPAMTPFFFICKSDGAILATDRQAC
ncbi:hypothetical protein, partial [Alcanivorax sp. P2S70]|uniref:hypothetical protein n=1 Tax=Alcanivorax sp. P2S70 TaxID=1397527 RepID=UPI001F317ED2